MPVLGICFKIILNKKILKLSVIRLVKKSSGMYRMRARVEIFLVLDDDSE